MRARRIALAALVVLSVLNASAVFAKGAGGAAGGAAGGGTGGAGPGGGGPPITTLYTVPNEPQRLPRPHYTAGKEISACFKQEPLYNRHGDLVANLHGADCFQ